MYLVNSTGNSQQEYNGETLTRWRCTDFWCSGAIYWNIAKKKKKAEEWSILRHMKTRSRAFGVFIDFRKEPEIRSFRKVIFFSLLCPTSI